MRTDSGVIMGTVYYMSPEQIRGVGVDARTDIWSLGVLLYELVAQRRPFEEERVVTLSFQYCGRQSFTSRAPQRYTSRSAKHPNEGSDNEYRRTLSDCAGDGAQIFVSSDESSKWIRRSR